MNRPKQTAANNELLKAVKAKMNAKIFKATASIVNDQGEFSALEFLQQFFNQPVTNVFPPPSKGDPENDFYLNDLDSPQSI